MTVRELYERRTESTASRRPPASHAPSVVPVATTRVSPRMAGGVRNGAASGSGEGVILPPVETRFRRVAGYVRKKLGDARHERRVAELASRLFTLTAAWHDLRATDLVALRLGCLLHDIGRSKDDALHPRLGARMIERAGELPLAPRERRLAAYLARYHRGAVPRCGHDDYLRRGEYRTAILLLAMLRAADALDSRSCGGASVTMERRPGDARRITLRARPHDDSPKARKTLTRPKKYRLLETVLRCEIRVRVE